MLALYFHESVGQLFITWKGFEHGGEICARASRFRGVQIGI